MKTARRLPSDLRLRLVVLELLSVSVPGDPSMFSGDAQVQLRRSNASTKCAEITIILLGFTRRKQQTEI